MKLLRADWMKELDAEAINTIGIPSIVLMENASQGAAVFFARRFPLERGYKNVVVTVGKGNNGGDGLAVGRILHQQGYNVVFMLLAPPEKLNPDPKINFQIIKNIGLTYDVVTNAEELEQFQRNRTAGWAIHETILVDAVLGTGIDRPVKNGFYADVIAYMNRTGYKVAAVDMPSGLSEAFPPEEGLHVKADATATFQCVKIAHIHPDGNTCCGDIEIIDIGIPKERVNDAKYYIHLITPDTFAGLFAKRAKDAHKGSYGHGLTIAGSVEKPGAGVLSSISLLKSGAGLCTCAVPFENRAAAVAAHPELMTLVYEKPEDLTHRLPSFDVLLMGPGLGDTKETLAMVTHILEHAQVPVILDADALNVLAGTAHLGTKRHFPVIITPHPGEFARLTGLTTAGIGRNRIDSARDFAVKNRVHVVLKGHHTIIALPDGQVFVNTTGNAGMATAGSGDVLGGMIAGMICGFQKRHPIKTILQAAVFLHGYAGDMAAITTGETSLTATDIIKHIPNAINGVLNNEFRISF